MKNTGQLFEDRFKSWHKGLDKVMCIKYPDNKSSGSSREAICDFLVLFRGMTAYIELKHTNNKVNFSFDLIKKHQLDKLLDIAWTDNPSFFLIENGFRELFLVTPQTILGYIKAGKKSIKFIDLGYCRIDKEHYLKYLKNKKN